MKLFFLLLLTSIIACNDPDKYTPALDPQDAGREFIRASLDGNYKKALVYLLKDSTNLTLLTQQQKNYQELNSEEKRTHREAVIRPLAIKNENDSVSTYKYVNSYNTRDTTTLKIVRVNGEWFVDLKSILSKD
jgi:hypothetical protein